MTRSITTSPTTSDQEPMVGQCLVCGVHGGWWSGDTADLWEACTRCRGTGRDPARESWWYQKFVAPLQAPRSESGTAPNVEADTPITVETTLRPGDCFVHAFNGNVYTIGKVTSEYVTYCPADGSRDSAEGFYCREHILVTDSLPGTSGPPQ